MQLKVMVDCVLSWKGVREKKGGVTSREGKWG